MQSFRIAIICAAVVAALLVLPGAAGASSDAAWGQLARPLSTVQLVALTAAGFLPVLFMLLRDRRPPTADD